MRRFGCAIALIAIAVCMLGATFSFAEDGIIPGKAVVRKTDGTIEVVRIASEGSDFSYVQTKAKEANDQLKRKSGGSAVTDYEMSKALTADVRNEGLPTLNELQQSESIAMAVPYVRYSIPENEREISMESLREVDEELIPMDSNRSWSYHAVQADAIERYFEEHDPSDVVVAVLDTGVFTNHDTLEGVCVTGYNTFENNNNVTDVSGHGTHVASIIAGKHERYVPGIAAGVKIMPVKVLDDEGFGSNASLAEGIEWAVANGADVINLSLGTSEPDALSERVIKEAVDSGVIVIAASGNESNHWLDNEEHDETSNHPKDERYSKQVNYPAGYPTVISVGSFGFKREVSRGLMAEKYFVSDFTNIGTDLDTNSGRELDVVAPGSDIDAAYLERYSYITNSGTSMAAPHVSAIAAALRVKHGEDITTEDVRHIFEVTSEKTSFIDVPGQWHSDGYDPYLGYGTVNARNALFSNEIASFDLLDDQGTSLLSNDVFNPEVHSYKIDIPSGVDKVVFDLYSPQGVTFVKRSDGRDESTDITQDEVTFTYRTTPSYGESTTYTFTLIKMDRATDPYLLGVKVDDGGILEWEGIYDMNPVLASPVSEGALTINLQPSSGVTEMHVNGGPATGPAISIDMEDGGSSFRLEMKSASGEDQTYYMTVEYFGEKKSETGIESVETMTFADGSEKETVEWTYDDTEKLFTATVDRETDFISLRPVLSNPFARIYDQENEEVLIGYNGMRFYENEFTYKVVAQDGTTCYYKFEVYKEGVDNTNYEYLKMVEPYEADFKSLSDAGNEYEVVLDKVYDEVQVVFSPESQYTTYHEYDERAKWNQGDVIKPGTPITVPLTNGEGKYKYWVLTDGYMRTHHLHIRQIEKDSSLEYIWISDGDLDPAFEPQVKKYEVELPESVAFSIVGAGTTSGYARLTIDGVVENVYAFAQLFEWNMGENKVDIVVTAENGDQTTYELLVIRGEVEANTDDGSGDGTDEDPDDSDKGSDATKKPSTDTGNSGGGGYIPPSNSLTEPTPTVPVDSGKDKVKIIESGNVSRATVSVSKKRVENLLKAAEGQPIKVELEENIEADKLELKVAKDIISKLKGEKTKVAVDTGNAVFELDGETMNDLLKDGDELAFATEEVKTPVTPKQSEKSLKTVAKVMELDILVDGEKIEKLEQPVDVTLTYDPDKVDNKYKLSVYWFNEEDGRWELIRSKRVADGSMRFTARHFSKYTVMESSKTFVDIESHWGRQFIEMAAAKGITYGVSETHFAPDNALRRSEFVTLISNLLDLPSGAPVSKHTDVPAEAWFSKSVYAAAEAGIIENTRGLFRPNDPITREEMASLLMEAYLYIHDMERGELFITQQVMFQDEGASSPEHRTDVRLMKALGIMVGDGVNFRPKDGATRAESMTVLIRLLQEMDGL